MVNATDRTCSEHAMTAIPTTCRKHEIITTSGWKIFFALPKNHYKWNLPFPLSAWCFGIWKANGMLRELFAQVYCIPVGLCNSNGNFPIFEWNYSTNFPRETFSLIPSPPPNATFRLLFSSLLAIICFVAVTHIHIYFSLFFLLLFSFAFVIFHYIFFTHFVWAVY